MGTLTGTGVNTECRIFLAHWVLLAGCLLATLPVFAAFLPIDLGVLPRQEPIPMALHLAAGLCAVGLVIAFLQSREATVQALAHPMVLAAMFVALWSALMAPASDYPWLSLIGVPAFGEAAVRYASLSVFFASAIVLAGNRNTFITLCAILLLVSFLSPIVMFVWADDFFVSLDLMGIDIEVLVVGSCFLRKEDQDLALKLDYKDAFELD